MQLFIHVVCVYVCIHTLSVYGITHTTLGNTGHNSKLMQHDDYTQVQNIVKGIGTGVQYRNSEQVYNALEQYAITKFPMIIYSIGDIEYSLWKADFLKDKNKYYEKNTNSYKEIPDEELQFYINELSSIKDEDVSNSISTTIDQFINKYMSTYDKTIANFITEALDYLVQQGTLSVQPNTAVANAVSDANDINNIVRNEPVHTALTTEINNKAHAVDTGVIDTAIDTNADINNIVRNEPEHTALTTAISSEAHAVPASTHSDVAHAVPASTQ